jgi:hypothetical protein
MARLGVFGTRPPSEITVVEPSESRRYGRTGRLAFWVCSVAGGLLGVVVGSHWLHSPVWLLAGTVAGAVAGSVVGLVVWALVVAWPVLRIVWHWLPEIAVTVALLLAVNTLAYLTALWVAGLIAAVLAGAVAGCRPVRHRVVAWWWCLVVRHRLRLCFAEFIRSASSVRYQGRFPLILAARPTPAGERVWVWLRPGLELTDLEGKTGRIAVACWAGEARVVRASASHAALIRIDTARRDPLAQVVTSPLARLFDDHTGEVAGLVSPGMAAVGLDLDDVPGDDTDSRTAGGNGRNRR